MNEAGSPQQAEWREGHAAMKAGQISRACELFRRAATDGFAPAQFDLGRLLVFGLVEDADAAEGVEWLRRAEAERHAPATYQLATLAMGDRLVPFDAAQVLERVCAAAEAGHSRALTTLGVFYGEDPSAEVRALGTLCLEHAAMRGDEVGMALLALRLLRGCDVAVNVPRAAAMIDLLTTRGLALPILAPSVPRASPAPAALGQLPPLPVPRPGALDTTAGDGNELCVKPSIREYVKHISEEQCLSVVLSAMRHMRPSKTADPEGRWVKVGLRTSDEALVDPLLEDVLLRQVQRRMAASAGLPVSHAEPLIVLRYAAGQEYRPHSDCLPGSLLTPVERGGSGQRVATVITYLNSNFAGGATVFPRLDLRVQPGAGNMLRFSNVDADGRPEPGAVHAGEPVTDGLKWICTLWMRQGPHRPQ
jgi:predicted 2-oxoglutarate/Fe(II)-dependent dioxygenase YbiX